MFHRSLLYRNEFRLDLNRSCAFCAPSSSSPIFFNAAVVFFLQFLLILQSSFLHSFMAPTARARCSFSEHFVFFSLFYFLASLSSAVPISCMTNRPILLRRNFSSPLSLDSSLFYQYYFNHYLFYFIIS